ncbi:MucBP domain-containing protein, partial [Listeria sp. FSL L7-1485]
MKFKQLGTIVLATALVAQIPLQVNAAGVGVESKSTSKKQITAEARVAAAPVTINHVYNETIFKTETLNGNVGEAYTTNQIEDPNWRVTTPANATGTFTSEPQTVTYDYTPSTVINVLQYEYRDIDTDGYIYVHNPELYSSQGRKLWETVATNANGYGDLGSPNTFTWVNHYDAMDEGYVFTDGTVGKGGTYDFVKASPENPATLPVRLPGEEQKVITLYYKYHPVTVTGQDVTVKYVDTEGNEIASSETLSGNVDDNYTSEAKTIAGYTLTETPSNATGTFSDTAQTVTYVYQKD